MPTLRVKIAMAGISVWEMLIVLFVLGVGAAVLALFVAAIANNRLGIAVLVGGLALLALLIGSGAVVLYAFRAHPVAEVVHLSSPSPPTMHRSYGRISFIGLGLLFFIGAVLALIVTGIRRHTPSHYKGERRAWWPALLAIPLMLLFFVSSIRVQRSVHHSNGETAHQAVQEQIGRQQKHIARQAAKVEEVGRRIANSNIHELEDKFDAPRIALAPPKPPAPPSVAGEDIAAAETTEASVDSTTKSDEPKHKTKAEEAETAKVADSTVADEKDDTVTSDGKSASDRQIAGVKPAQTTEGSETATAEDEKSLSDAEVKTSEPPAAPRPAWVDNPPRRIGAVAREVIVTDEWSTEKECVRARDIELMLKTHAHLQRLIGAPDDGYMLDDRINLESVLSVFRRQELAHAGITVDYARREIAKEEYLERTERSVGPMMRLYTLVEFSPAVDRELLQRWQSHRRQERFFVVGAGAASVLGLLGFVLGLLKIDTWTRGYYTKRLFLGVPAAIIGGFLLFLVVDIVAS